METTRNQLKCNWCDWSTLLWRTQKNGRRRSGWNLLIDHVIDCHESVPEVTAFIARVVDDPNAPDILVRDIAGLSQ